VGCSCLSKTGDVERSWGAAGAHCGVKKERVARALAQTD
jgi:hypothetical protein